jgi:hypothetical protein
MSPKQTRFSKRAICCSNTTLGVAVWLLLTLLPGREVRGQGTVQFNTRISGAAVNQTGHIWAPSTTYPGLSLIGLGSNDSPSSTTPFGSATGMALIGAGGSGGQYGYRTTFAQLIGALGQNMPESALVPLAGVTTFRSGTSLGCVATITSTFTNNPASVDAPWATVEIVAWDNSSGQYPTWAQASVAWMQGLISAGHSAAFNVANIGGTANAVPFLTSAGQTINGLSFNLVPGGLPPPGPPSATTGPATDITPEAATLNGTVYPNGAWGTSGWFEWGTNTDYGNYLGAYVNNMCRYCVIPVSSGMFGLTPGATYHFRLVAQSGVGTAYGGDDSFTAPGPATAATLPATAVTATTATLNGTANANGWPATAWFEWGATTNYGTSTPVTNIGSARLDLPLSATVSGLSPGTTYHFRIVARTETMLTPVFRYGEDQSFTTWAPLTINRGGDNWKAGCTNLSYQGGTPNFILLQSPSPTTPLSDWTRIATNTNTPGSFAIPPVGTAGPQYYRVMSE